MWSAVKTQDKECRSQGSSLPTLHPGTLPCCRDVEPRQTCTLKVLQGGFLNNEWPQSMLPHTQHCFKAPPGYIDWNTFWTETLRRTSIYIYIKLSNLHWAPLMLQVPWTAGPWSCEAWELPVLTMSRQCFSVWIPDEVRSAFTALVFTFLSKLWIRRNGMLNHCFGANSEFVYSLWNVQRKVRSVVNRQLPRGGVWLLISHP